MASSQGRLEVVKKLVDAGADINAKMNVGGELSTRLDSTLTMTVL